MTFPDRSVRLDDGTTVPSSKFWRKRSVAFVFLRHFGCVFCRQHVAHLSRRSDLPIVLVGMGSPERGAAFRAESKTPFPIVCDAERELYDAVGLGRTTLARLLTPSVIRKGILAGREGFRNDRPDADALALGGTFVVDESGEIRWSRPAKDVADNATVEEIERALRG